MNRSVLAQPRAAWPKAKMSALGTLLTGQSPPTTSVNRDGRGTAYVSGPEQWDGSRVHAHKWTTQPKRIAPTGSIFVTVKGAGVGKVFPGINAAIGRDIYAFVPAPDVVPRFVEHALRHSIQEVLRHAAGDIPGLSKRHILDHEIPAPPHGDQRAIVAEIEKQFSRLDEAVASLERAKANLARYKAAILKAAVEGRLVPTEASLSRLSGQPFESGAELLARLQLAQSANFNSRRRYRRASAGSGDSLPSPPDGWAWSTIKDLLIEPIVNGLSIKGSSSPPGVPALRLNAMTSEGLDYSYVRYLPVALTEVEDIIVRQGDFFVSRGNGSLDLVGRGAMAKSSPAPVIFPDLMMRLRFVCEVSEAGWVNTIWPSRWVRDQVEKLVKTTAGIYKIAQPELASITIPSPRSPSSGASWRRSTG